MLLQTEQPAVASSDELGALKVMHLKRYWEKAQVMKGLRNGNTPYFEEWATDVALLGALGLGLEQTLKYLYVEDPSFDAFEKWILEVNGGTLNKEKIDYFHAALRGSIDDGADTLDNVLSQDDLDFWNKNGYIIIRGAVPREDCEKTVALICEYLEIDRHDPGTWYNVHKDRQGIMVQLFQHELLQRNRENKRIRQAFEQLWQRKDIYVNTDRVGFNPPETALYKFPGPKLHWDVSIAQPIPFGTQGILYLADTAANQGAFTLIPGFQNTIGDWLKSLPQGTNPRTVDLYKLGPVPLAASAGDFILWHQALPHGSSPNTSDLPRFVQYINYQPIDPEIAKIWL